MNSAIVAANILQRLSSSQGVAQSIYNTHAARVSADGGVIDNPSATLNYISDLVTNYSFTSEAALQAKINLAVEVGIFGYKVGSGTGLTTGMACEKLYSLNPLTDLVQSTAANQPLLVRYDGSNKYYFNSRSTASCFVRTDTGLSTYNSATDTLRYTGRIYLNNQTTASVDFLYTAGGAFIAAYINKGTQVSFRFRGSANATDSSNFTKPAQGWFWFRITSSPTTITYEASGDNVTDINSVTNWTSLGTTARPALGAISATQHVCNSATTSGNAVSVYYGKFENVTTGATTTFNPNLYDRINSESTWVDADCSWSVINAVATTGIKGFMVDESKIAGDGVAMKMSVSYVTTQPYTVYVARKRQGTGPVYGLAASSQLSNDATNTTLSNGTALNIANSSTAKQLITAVVNDDSSSIQIDNGTATTGDSGPNNGTYIDVLANGSTYGNFILTSLMIVNGN